MATLIVVCLVSGSVGFLIGRAFSNAVIRARTVDVIELSDRMRDSL